MGVAQSSLNKLGATIGTSALAISNAAGKAADAKKEAKEDVAFSNAELKQAQAAEAEIGNQLGDAKNALAEAEGNNTIWENQRPHRGLTAAALAEKRQQALDDLTAAQRAFDELSKKDTAAKAMTARWKLRLENAQNKVDKLSWRKK